MAAYIEHIRALARRIHQSDTLPLRWHQNNNDEGLYYFLAAKMKAAGLLDAEQDNAVIAVRGLTEHGRNLVDPTSDLTSEVIDEMIRAFYADEPPNKDMSPTDTDPTQDSVYS